MQIIVVIGAKMKCLCVNCLNGRILDVKIIREHLLCDGFFRSYTTWRWHGELLNLPCGVRHGWCSTWWCRWWSNGGHDSWCGNWVFCINAWIWKCTALVVGSDDVAPSYSVGVLTRRQIYRREGSQGAREVASYEAGVLRSLAYQNRRSPVEDEVTRCKLRRPSDWRSPEQAHRRRWRQCRLWRRPARPQGRCTKAP